MVRNDNIQGRAATNLYLRGTILLRRLCDTAFTSWHEYSGLDSRHMISCLKPPEFKVHSLTTIATPHRGIGLHIITVWMLTHSNGRFCICRLYTEPHRPYELQHISLTRWSNRGTAIQLPKVYKALDFFGFQSGAFSQLTREYMQHTFNPNTPDDQHVK